MTTGSGLSLAPNESDPRKLSAVIRQLLEGRGNTVGTVTLTSDGTATTTTVTAQNCGPNSIVFMAPLTADAAAAAPTTYVKKSDITAGQFVVTHIATTFDDETFGWVCLG
jgi:hypothetical protein